MKRSKYKITLALSSFLMASVCLATSTYAWFAMADDLQVDNIGITIKATQHIDLGFYSADDAIHKKYGSDLGEWADDIFYLTKGNVSTEVLHDFGQYNYNTLFSPLTASWTEENMVYQTSAYSPILTKMPIPGDVRGKRVARRDENSYLQFECYVRSTHEDVYAFIQPQTTIEPNTVKNAANATASNSSLEDLNSVVNYMRYSFYSYNEASSRRFYQIYEPNPTNDYQKTSYFGRLDVDPYDGYYDFSYETNNETVYGAYTGTPSYNESARATEKPTRNDGFLGITYPDVSPFSLEDSIAGGFVGKQEKALTPKDVQNHNEVANSIGRIDVGTPQKMIITCWSEGWDRDCSSYSGSASFIMNLAISSEPVSRYDL